MQTVTLASRAMATRFEIVLHGENASSLRAAGEEALREVDRLENQLSLYRPGSEIAQINARAARESVRVSPEVFALLDHARQLTLETGGAFDITIAPLVRCWGFMGAATSPSWAGAGAVWSAQPEIPAPEAIARALELVGMKRVQLDALTRTVRFERDGVMLDLGAIGKGYAVECAGGILREAGVTSALIHGGTSTVCAIGNPPDAPGWKVAIELPPPALRPSAMAEVAPVDLMDEAMSVSAIWGRCFESHGQIHGHVIDPRTGQPTAGALLAMVALPSGTETDALSTALLTLGAAGHARIASLRPNLRSLLVTREGGAAAGNSGQKAIEKFSGGD